MSKLFSPINLGNLELRNRIVVSPMCQYSAEHGQASDWHLIHLGHMALSGAGLLFIEATSVTPVGRISAGDLGLWSDQTEAALARVIKSIRQYSDIPIGIQLTHAGRKASVKVPWQGGQSLTPAHGGWQTVAPSAVPFAADGAPPHALDEAGLEHLRNDFVAAAQRAHRLGMDAVELHAAHGYLLHQFLSPLSNIRTDQYGGSLENRMRFPLEIFELTRAAVTGNLPVGVRLSASDWVVGGWDTEQSVIFVKDLQRRGCSFVDVS
ncbi:MAG: oxidoreductase, partial [Gallionella sp.]